jgi:hypothetical protein
VAQAQALELVQKLEAAEAEAVRKRDEAAAAARERARQAANPASMLATQLMARELKRREQAHARAAKEEAEVPAAWWLWWLLV